MKKSMFGSAVVAAVALLAGVVQAQERAIIDSTSKSSENSLYNTNCWGIVAFDSNTDYRIPTTASALNVDGAKEYARTFAGHDLIVEHADGLWLYNGNGSVASFTMLYGDLIFSGNSSPKLRHRQVAGNNNPYTIKGDGTFRVNGNMRFQHVKTAPYGFDLRLQMKMAGTKNITFEQYNKYNGFIRFCIENDAKDYTGTINVGAYNNSSIAVASNFNGQVNFAKTGCGVEQIGVAAQMRKVVVNDSMGDDFYFKLSTNGVFQIDDLTCGGGVIRYLPCGTTKNVKQGYLKLGAVTLNNGGTFKIDVCPQALMMNAINENGLTNVVKLVEYTGTTENFAANFDSAVIVTNNTWDLGYGIALDPGAVTLTNATDEAGHQIIYAHVENKVVTHLNRDASDGTYAGSSLRTDASDAFYQAKWSDGLRQHAGAHYILPQIGVDGQLMICDGKPGSASFLGSSLIALANVCVTPCGGTSYLTNLVMLGGSYMNAYGNCNYLKGTPVTFKKTASNTIVSLTPNSSDISFDAGIKGDASICLSTSGGASKTRTFYLPTENLDFRGKVELKPAGGSRAIAQITNAKALGGPLAAFAADALLIYSNQVLNVMGTTTFDDATRGWTIRSYDNETFYAAIFVDNNATATVKVPIAFNGELRKNGEGTLAMGGSVTFESEDGVVSEGPIEGRNKLTIETGNLAVLTTNAVDGLAITFKNNCGLVIDASTAEMKRYGLYNTKWSVPLVKESGKLAVSFTNATLASDAKLAICTVPTADKTLTVDSFNVAKQPGLHITVTEEADEASGTTTFYANFQSAGLMLFVR